MRADFCYLCSVHSQCFLTLKAEQKNTAT